MTKRPEYTQEKFCKDYAEASGMSYEQFQALLGRYHARIELCNCEDDLCRGWQVIFEDEDEGDELEDKWDVEREFQMETEEE